MACDARVTVTAPIWNIQLVFDASDPDVVMLFWGPKLGYVSEQTSMTPDELREWRRAAPWVLRDPERNEFCCR